MALELTRADFTNEEKAGLIVSDPTGWKFKESVDPGTGKTLKEMTWGELRQWNLDINAIAAQYASGAVRLALEKYLKEALIVCRAVMYSAAQPYGGAVATGNEICMRMIKPVDMNYTIQEIWDLDLSGEAVGDIWGFQTGGTTPASDTMTRQEGNLIVGFADPVPLTALASYQVIKSGKTYPYFTITFTPCAADQLPFMECMAPIAEFPLDVVTIQMDVGRAINPDRFQAIGPHFCRASDIIAATGSGGS